MRAPEAVRFGAVSAAGMALCCSLTALATAGTLSATVGWMGGSIGLGVVAGLGRRGALRAVVCVLPRK